jgi:putative MFS transporter
MASLSPALVLLFVAIGGVVMGYFADRFGRKIIMYTSILIYALATLLRAATFNYVYFLVFTAIAGIGLGGEFGVGQSLITEIVPQKSRGFWSGAFYGAAGFGILIAASVGMYLLPVVGFRWVFVFSGLISFLAFIFMKLTPESIIWKKEKNLVKKEKVTVSIWNPKIFWSLILMLILATMQFFMYYLVNSSLPIYLVSKGLTIIHASWYIFLIGSGVTTGSYLGAYLSDIIGRRAVGSLGAILVVIVGTILYFMGKGFLTSPFVLIPLFFLGIGFSVPAQVLGVFFSEQFPTVIRATGTSTVLQVARGLSFFPPIVAVYLFQTTGSYSIVFLIAVVIALIEAGFFWIFRETKGIDLIKIDKEKLKIDLDSIGTESKVQK